MGREDGGDFDSLMCQARNGHAGHPFVEMGEDRSISRGGGEMAEEFGDGESEGDDLVDFAVVIDRADAMVLPEKVFVVSRLEKRPR